MRECACASHCPVSSNSLRKNCAEGLHLRVWFVCISIVIKVLLCIYMYGVNCCYWCAYPDGAGHCL